MSGIVVLAIAATLVAGGGILAALGTTAASFTDRVIETATMGAGTLPAPQSLSAAPDGVAVDLAWTPAAGDFADEYEVFRVAGVCPGTLGYLSSIAAPATAYEDTGVTPGNTYCYAVRGTAGADWTSSFSNTAQVSLPIPETRLYTYRISGSDRELRTDAGNGSCPFSCTLALVVLELRLNCSQPGHTFRSEGPVAIYDNQDWSASLDISNVTGLNVVTAIISISVWYENEASCGGVPASSTGRLIATGQRSWGLALLNNPLGNDSPHLFTLTGDAGFSAPDGPRTLCMRPTLSLSGLLALTLGFNVNDGNGTWVEGPFAP